MYNAYMYVHVPVACWLAFLDFPDGYASWQIEVWSERKLQGQADESRDGLGVRETLLYASEFY